MYRNACYEFQCTVINQIGIVLTNFLISIFADAYVRQDLMFSGALFHAFMPSLMNVLFDNSEKLNNSCESYAPTRRVLKQFTSFKSNFYTCGAL